MKAKILRDDLIGRFKIGDIGSVIDNDYEKYDYRIEFDDGRIIYFYEDEIELFSDVTTEGKKTS